MPCCQLACRSMSNLDKSPAKSIQLGDDPSLLDEFFDSITVIVLKGESIS